MRRTFQRRRSTLGQVPLRPTAAGGFWLLAVEALLATAINYGNNLVFAFAFLLLAVWLQSAWASWRNLAGADWRPAPVPPAFAGESLQFAGTLKDTRGRPRHALALARDRESGPAADLAAYGDVPLALPCPATRRGTLTLAGIALVSRHPLGLWQASRPLPPASALIYPHPAGDQPLPASSPRPAHREAAADDFQGVRPYAPGDSPRRINWRAFGRREELVVNQFDGGRGGDALWLDWDLCRGNGEARLAQLARWVLEADRSGRDYGLRLPGASLAPARGRLHREACLARLALFDLVP